MKWILFFAFVVPQALCQTAKIKDMVGNNGRGTVAVHADSKSAAVQSPECTNIYGKGLRVCSAVHASGKTIDGVICNESLCKASCCNAAKVCQKANFFSLSTEECISTRLTHDMGSCCIVGKSKGSTVVYAGGALGAAIICSGLYFIVSMGSKKKVVKGEKPADDDDPDDTCKLYETKTPHMQVNQLIATDADDVFWED